jgi:hypothetical protein
MKWAYWGNGQDSYIPTWPGLTRLYSGPIISCIAIIPASAAASVACCHDCSLSPLASLAYRAAIHFCRLMTRIRRPEGKQSIAKDQQTPAGTHHTGNFALALASQQQFNGKAKGDCGKVRQMGEENGGRGGEFVICSIPLIESNYFQSLINNTAAAIATDHVVVNRGNKRPSLVCYALLNESSKFTTWIFFACN